MAEQEQKIAQEQLQVKEQETVLTDVPMAECENADDSAKVAAGDEPPPLPETEEKKPVNSVPVEGDEPASAELENLKAHEKSGEKITELCSFKEESNRVSDLSESEKRALDELKVLVRDALNNREFTAPPPLPTSTKEEETQNAVAEEQKENPVEEKEEKSSEEAPPAPEAAPEETQKGETDNGSSKTEDEAEKQSTKCGSVDEDGAKTVEAIEETVVAVSSVTVHPSELQSTASQTEEPKSDSAVAPPQPPPEEVSIWGIPLLADERSDVVLLKFLRARDFRVKDAFTMIKNVVRWRKEFGIEELLQEDLGDDLNKVVFMHGFDKEGHPVCYNVYGEFQDKQLYKKTFSDEEKRQKFLRWRIQFLERSIRKLDFTPGGISAIVQVNDLNNSPGPGKWELRQATKQALHVLQDNYPEFVAKQVFINVPWWYLAVSKMISPFLTQRTKSKFVSAGPSKSAETLLRYIAAEQLPLKYGGLSRDGEFDGSDPATELIVKPAAKGTVEFAVNDPCLVMWEVRVVGREVSYGAEFVPSAEGSYTAIIHKARKISSSEEPVAANSFKISEPGKVVLTIGNPTSKKKKFIYRFKTKPSD